MAKMFDLKSSSTAYTKEEYIIIHHKKNNNHNIYKKTNKKISTKPKGAKRRVGTIGALCIVLLILCASGYQAGFTPFKAFLRVYEPIGVTGEINIDDCVEMIPAIANTPSIDKLKHKLFTSDKSINIVALDYKQRLEKRGYRLEYVGKENILGITVNYFGFVRGITAIGIIMTKDGNSLLGSGTLVLYTTGSVFAYNKILEWYGASNVKSSLF
jgi:hypothetical protein